MKGLGGAIARFFKATPPINLFLRPKEKKEKEKEEEMSYPSTLEVSKLETKHPEVAINWETFETIEDLCEGGERLYSKRRRYIKKKPDEPDNVYQFRLSHFTYDPIIAENINKMVTRLSSASYVVEGISQTGEEAKKWNKFRRNFNGEGQEESEFLEQVFESLIKFRKVYAVLDYPEEGSDVPYVSIFDPRSVVNFDKDWVKIRQVKYQSSPIGESEIYLEWIIIDKKKIIKYKADLEMSEKEELVYKSLGSEIRQKVQDVMNGEHSVLVASKVSEIEHGWGKLPVVAVELKAGLWVTNLVCHLMKEHLKLHNNISTTAALAGQIQRLFTPLQETESRVYDIQETKLQTGNEHILVGQNFSYNETQGSAVKTVQGYIDNLEKRIKDLLFSAGISSGQQQPSQESGVAKSLDFVSQEQALRSYGQVITKFYKQILQLVGEKIENDPSVLEEINVNGLNEFLLDSLDNKVERLQKIADLSNKIPLSNTAFRIIVEDLQKSMTQYASPEDIEKIRKETMKNWSDERLPRLDLSEINDLVLDGIIDKSTARSLLNLDPEKTMEKINQEMMEEAETQAEANSIMNPQPTGFDPEITFALLDQYANELEMPMMEVITQLEEETGLDLSALADQVGGIEAEKEMSREKMLPEEKALESLSEYLKDYDYTEEDIIQIGEESENEEEFYQTLIDLLVEESGMEREEVLAEILADMNT